MAVLVQPTTADWMSYCEPAWVSEFFYSNVLRYRHDSHDPGRGCLEAMTGSKTRLTRPPPQ